jgi:hypothetical protein
MEVAACALCGRQPRLEVTADGRWIDQQESDGFEGWMDWSGGMKPDPTHWMPLPTAPGAAIQPTQPDESDRLFVLLCEIRAAAGDNGERMQSELVPFIAGLARDKARLDSGVIMTSERDDIGEEYTCERRGLDLRAMIDAAMEAQERDKQ